MQSVTEAPRSKLHNKSAPKSADTSINSDIFIIYIFVWRCGRHARCLHCTARASHNMSRVCESWFWPTITVTVTARLLPAHHSLGSSHGHISAPKAMISQSDPPSQCPVYIYTSLIKHCPSCSLHLLKSKLFIWSMNLSSIVIWETLCLDLNPTSGLCLNNNFRISSHNPSNLC